MKVKLTLNNVEQVIDVSHVEIFGRTREEIDRFIYDKYVQPFLVLHSKVDIDLIGFEEEGVGRPSSSQDKFNLDSLLEVLIKRRAELLSLPKPPTDYDENHLQGSTDELGYVIDLILSKNNVKL
jgi:hypothetical protein